MLRVSLLICALLLVFATPVHAEISEAEFSAALEKYLETEAGQDKLGSAVQAYFKRFQDRMRKEQEQKASKELEQQFENPVKIDVGNSPFKGPKDAKITIVEFSDFQCPFCSRGDKTMKQLLKDYPKDVKLVFMNLPLPFHNEAVPAAKAALAAGEQGKFWEMHDVLFEKQQELGAELYVATAKKLGLNVDKFKKDMESEQIAKKVEEDTALAKKLGFRGTPGFSVNGVFVKGAHPPQHFKQIIDRWLEKLA